MIGAFIILMIILLACVSYTYGLYTKYKELEKDKQKAVGVVKEIRVKKMLYTRHPHFALTQHHIDRILYPNREA